MMNQQVQALLHIYSLVVNDFAPDDVSVEGVAQHKNAFAHIRLAYAISREHPNAAVQGGYPALKENLEALYDEVERLEAVG
jgi:Holliday junction resolvasome RuvABC endonuclease subunit